jgi:lipid-A-disaccharide synthase
LIRPALGLAPGLAELRERFAAQSNPMIVSSDVYDLVAASDLVITKTGTTTVECAILGTPMVTAYKMGFLNYVLARLLVRIPYIAMPNIILNHPIVPELIQDKADPKTIADEAHHLLTNEQARAEQISGLAQVRTELGPPGAPARAALSIAGWIESLPSRK